MATAKTAKKSAVAPAVKPEALILIPLDELVLSEKNVRKNGNLNIEPLAESIFANGLQQNLNVEPQLNGKGKPTGIYEVTAGGRRLRACQLLVKQNRWAPARKVWCRIIEAGTATSSSLVENTDREPMHPADEFDAFKRYIEEGHTVEETAAAFRVTPLVVSRRLKLANCSPKLITAYRNDEMTLDALMAFSIVDDKKRQEAVFKEIQQKGGSVNPHQVRAYLVDQKIDSSTDRRAIFVGVDAYEAAGGKLLKDLFSDQHRCYLLDEQLLDKLVSDKLENASALVRASGWSWVDVRTAGINFGELKKYGTVTHDSREPTAHERKARAEINKRIKDLDAEQERLESIPFAQRDRERQTQVSVDLELAEEQKDSLLGELFVFSDEQKATAGVIVTLSESGRTVTIHRGLIRPEDGKKAKGAKETGPQKGQAAAAQDDDHLSASLIRDLTASRTAALQAVVADSSQIALVVIAHHLALEVFKGHAVANGGLLQIGRFNMPYLDLEEDCYDGKAGVQLNHQHTMLEKLLGESLNDSATLFARLQELPDEHLLKLIRYCVARHLYAVTRADTDVPADMLASTVNLDMSAWWRPTAANYFSWVTKPQILRDVADACGDLAAKQISSLGKDAAAQRAAELIAKSDQGRENPWLPKILRAGKESHP